MTNSNLLEQYEQLVGQLHKASQHVKDAHVELSEAQSKLDLAIAEETRLTADLATVRETLKKALGSIEPEPTKAEPSDDVDRSELRPSIRDTVEAFPVDGDVKVAELKKLLNLSEGAVNTRLKLCRKEGLVDRVEWGRYALTEKGKKVRAPRLHAVPTTP